MKPFTATEQYLIEKMKRAYYQYRAADGRLFILAEGPRQVKAALNLLDAGVFEQIQDASREVGGDVYFDPIRKSWGNRTKKCIAKEARCFLLKKDYLK